MTSKDLMIGDWVMYDPNVFIEDEYESPKKPYPVQIQSGDEIDLAIEGCYSPIPLTIEILEKNRFLYKKLKGIGDNEIWRIEDDYFDIDIYEWSDSIWVFRYDCCEMSLPHTQVTMSYVHELQHALRLCGIEKEITL